MTPQALETWLRHDRRAQGAAARRRSAATRRRCSQTATQNAKQSLMLYKTRRSADFTTRSQALEDIQEALGMAEAPLRIECYDVSHLSGTNIVASMVVFEDGLPRKDQYRRFTIPNSTDDTDSIHQVLTRRLAYLERRRGRSSADARRRDGADGADGRRRDAAAASERRKKFAYRPNLLIVDGGQPQVAAAARALEESGVEGIYALRHREAARGDLAARRRLPGDPAAQQRCALPASSGSATRRTASRSPTSASGASATSAACSPRSRVSARRG